MTMPTTDPLRPTERVATEAWAARVRAGREQIERLREIEDPADFYAPMARRFARDPHRTDEPALDALRSMAEPGDTWLDLGAGGGRYSLPLALEVARVHAIDPSPSMLDVLCGGMSQYGIDNIDITAGEWPLEGDAPPADVALMAHVGYGIEAFGAFLDAAEAAVSRRCVVVMRASDADGSRDALWHEIHGEPRVPYPMLQELLMLLVARDTVPEVALVDRGTWGSADREELLDASRRQLWLRPGSTKDRALQDLVKARATERNGDWAIDWVTTQDGVVSWQPSGAA
ncbi:MAG: hypothetical protein U9O18_06580 [Chloroflexota bacterium]|nr:hypothetical protein [Chloroflexota bacterium]